MTQGDDLEVLGTTGTDNQTSQTSKEQVENARHDPSGSSARTPRSAATADYRAPTGDEADRFEELVTRFAVLGGTTGVGSAAATDVGINIHGGTNF